MSATTTGDNTVYSGMSQYSEQGSCTDAIYSLHYRVHQQGETFTLQVSRQHISLENKHVATVTNMNFKSMMSLVVQIIGNPSRQANFFAQHLDNANQQLLGPPSPTIFYDSQKLCNKYKKICWILRFLLRKVSQNFKLDASARFSCLLLACG